MTDSIIAYVLQALQAIPLLIQAGQDVVSFIENTSQAVNTMRAQDRDPTPAEWDAMHASIQALRDQLNSVPGSSAVTSTPAPSGAAETGVESVAGQPVVQGASAAPSSSQPVASAPDAATQPGGGAENTVAVEAPAPEGSATPAAPSTP